MCVCVLVNLTLWGQNVLTKIGVSEILVLVGTFFGPQEENSFINHTYFENVRTQKVVCVRGENIQFVKYKNHYGFG